MVTGFCPGGTRTPGLSFGLVAGELFYSCSERTKNVLVLRLRRGYRCMRAVLVRTKNWGLHDNCRRSWPQMV